MAEVKWMPEGPVLEIRMQGRDGWWCGECGRDDFDKWEITHERIVSDDGTAGYRVVCLACARRLGLTEG